MLAIQDGAETKLPKLCKAVNRLTNLSKISIRENDSVT